MTNLIRRSGSLIPTFVSDFFNKEGFYENDLLNMSNDILNPAWGFRKSVPAVNLTERDKDFLIEMAAPGLSKKDFKVELEDNMLTISAEKEEKKEEKENGSTRTEFSYNSFSRSFTLPENCKTEKIESKYENGILSIEIPKKDLTIAKTKKQITVS